MPQSKVELAPLPASAKTDVAHGTKARGLTDCRNATSGTWKASATRNRLAVPCVFSLGTQLPE